MNNLREPRSHCLITPLQQRFIHVFQQLPDHSYFFLTGGTALAEYYLGHRLSFDLDFFTSEEGAISPVSFQLEDLLKKSNLHYEVVRRLATYVELLITNENDSLRVDLALDSPFRFNSPLLCPPGIWVNNYDDLCVDKLLAYYRRAEPRNAVDLFFILNTGDSHDLFGKAKLKDPGFDLYWFAVALNRCQNFPDEGARWPVKMLVDWDPIQIKHSFRKLAIDIMEDL